MYDYTFEKGELYAICEILETVMNNTDIIEKIKSENEIYDTDVITKLLAKVYTMCDLAVGQNQQQHEHTEQEQIMLGANIILNTPDMYDFVLDKKISIHPVKTAIGYTLDIYHYNTDEQLVNPEHDHDNDYIDSIDIDLTKGQ